MLKYGICIQAAPNTFGCGYLEMPKILPKLDQTAKDWFLYPTSGGLNQSFYIMWAYSESCNNSISV
jgi:hypothetical protein